MFGFVIGFLIGGPFGVLLMALLVIARRNDPAARADRE